MTDIAMSQTAPPAIGLFPGETAIVTGAASSIGRGIALALAREGAEIVAVDVDGPRNDEVVAAIKSAGGTAVGLTIDLSQPGAEAAVLAAVRAPVHMLVHSASPPRHERDHVETVDPATWDAMMTTNARTGFFLGRDLALRMRAVGIAGRMLYLTSLHAGTPRNLPHYSASKAGMTMIVRELARAFGPDGIRVNALAPGAVPGGGAKNITAAFKARIPMRRVGTPADMAGTALALLSNRFTPYVTGATLAVDGGLDLYNWIPFVGADAAG
jgi:NAD(P)-dependent dehydrogenase (short-subunit alcohol dehydrogenase family)